MQEMKPADKTTLYRELAKLTQADFHLDRSLTLLLGQKTSPGRRAFLLGMQRGLSEGKSVSESVREHSSHLVTGLELALIESGERSGQLSSAFHHLARYFASAENAARQMRGAMIYPLILLHLAILLPEIPAAIVRTEGPGFTVRILIMVGALWLLLAGIYVAWLKLEERALTSASVDRWLNRVPLIGPARHHWAMARFCQVFHSGLLAALRMSEITRLAGEAAQSGLIRAASHEAADSIELGEQLSLSLADTQVFDPLFINALATAEEVGKLDEEMARWTTAETLSASESIERASLWLPKIGYGLVVIFVVYRIFGMVQGYYGGMLEQIERL